ncbi:MAG: hypothetical protein AB7N65_27625, partial [Vicinamibacterales bacterium]
MPATPVKPRSPVSARTGAGSPAAASSGRGSTPNAVPNAIMLPLVLFPIPLRVVGWSLAVSVLTLTVAFDTAGAQPLRGEPVVLGDGRVTVSGDVSASVSCAWAPRLSGCSEDLGYFNYGDYDDNLLRLFRVNVSASVKASRRVSVLTELRSDNLRHPEPYALYVRVRPWVDRQFDIQAGRIPPSFGAFSRRPYPTDNLLIGYPLAYQYLTSLRPDALPADADELLRMRGRGWLASYSIGELQPDAGLPLFNGLAWDTGVQAHAATDRLDAAISVTTGTLTRPRVREDNDGKQWSGRVGVQPVTGLVAGVSAARGPFVSRSAAEAAGLLPGGEPGTQAAWGADLEYSRGYYLVRAEAIVSTFRLPRSGEPSLDVPLRAVAGSLEGRYRVRPGLYAAARFDRLTFNEVAGSGGRSTWEAPLWRVEAGMGYSLQ